MGDANGIQGSRFRSHEFPSFASNPDFEPFKKPILSEEMRNRNQRIPLSVNRSKLSVPFRSELCMLFQRGKCFYGQNCHYAHSLSDLRKPGVESVLSTERRLKVDYRRNGVGEMKPCYAFLSGERCPYGDRCRFSHSSINGGEEGLKILHKTRLCQNWMGSRFCPYGSRCIFAHGNAELQNHGAAGQEHGHATKLKVLSSQITNAETGIHTDNNMKPRVKRSFMEWDVAKIGRIYGDWLDGGCNIQICLS